jgi:hypothetical protein
MSTRRTLATAAAVAALAAPAAGAAPPSVPSGRPPVGTARAPDVPTRVTSARIAHGRLQLELACRAGGRLSVFGADRSADFACHRGKALVTLPRSVLERRRGGVLEVTLGLQSAGRVSRETVRRAPHAARSRHLAQASAYWLDAATYCYDRTASSGGGGFQEVSFSGDATFGYGYFDTLYVKAWIHPWYESTGGWGAWMGSDVMYHTPMRGGWSTGGYTVYDPINGYRVIIGGTTAGQWTLAPWVDSSGTAWSAKYIGRRTYTVAGLEVWKTGGTHVYHDVLADSNIGDPYWCHYW